MLTPGDSTGTQIQAFIFDLDGVITDTAEYHYQAWKQMADEEGLPFTREDNEKLRGVSRQRSLELLLNGVQVSDEKKIDMMERKNNYYTSLLNNITPSDLLPGAGELLQQLKARGCKMAVASASKNAQVVIDRLGITDLFGVIADGYSVVNTKPAPDLFLFAAESLGVDPGACVVVEDAEAGVEAGLAAGMTVVGIGPVERVGKAHYRYDKIGDVRLLDIL